MYTEKGLFLLKGIDHSPRINSFTDLKNSGGIEEWTLTAEEHGDEKGSIGHSSFFEKDEYSKQRDIEKESKKLETEESLRLTYNESQQSNNDKFYRPIERGTFQLEADI